MIHLQWLCELKRYPYVCSFKFHVILGRLQWNGVGGISIMTSNKIVHPNFNPSTLANDIAILRLPTPVTYTSEYPSPVSLILLFMCTAATCDRYSKLWILHILGVETHTTDSVTHNDKVIITKDGQQTGPTINHVGVAAFHNF